MPTRNSSDIEDNLVTEKFKKAKTTPERPRGLCFVTTPLHSKRRLEDVSPAAEQSSKCSRRARRVESVEFHTVESCCIYPSENLQEDDLTSKPRPFWQRANPWNPETMISPAAPKHLVDCQVDDIETEVERRLAQNERRRKNRLDESRGRNGIERTAKRKRDSGDSTGYSESTVESVERLNVSRKSRKRRRRKSAQDDPSNNIVNHLSLPRGKRKWSTSEKLDGIDDIHEATDEENGGRRKKIALAVT